MYIYWFSSDSG